MEGVLTAQNNFNPFLINVFEAWAKFKLPLQKHAYSNIH